MPVGTPTATTTNEPLALPERKRNPFTKSADGGRTLSALMLPLFATRPPHGFGVLTTTGRRTGKARRKCIHVIRRGDRAYIVMLRPTPEAIAVGFVSAWMLNIRASSRVTLRIRGGTFTGAARELSDAGEIEEARRIYCETVNPFASSTVAGAPRVRRSKNCTTAGSTTGSRWWSSSSEPDAYAATGSS